ncbi:hypothetical protein BASA81_001111 [Batrachochytrium salamandrivorans]|nr:hypothetical protein BASA81_001111 [Batrachochytrium salamandrivorans]
MDQGVYHKEVSPGGAGKAEVKHAELREYIYKKTGYRRDEPLNILVFGPTQVGKGSTIQGICQALVPVDVVDPIPLRVGVGPRMVDGANRQHTSYLKPTLVENGFPITLWDCMGFDAFDEVSKNHMLAILTGFQKPNEAIDLTSTTANLVTDGEQFSPHIILFVISCADSNDAKPWLSTRPLMINTLLEMAEFVREIAHKQGSKIILVVTHRDVYEGFDEVAKMAADIMIKHFKGVLGTEVEDFLNNPERNERDWEVECRSLELVKRCVDKSVGIHRTTSSISYVLTITKAWYGIWDDYWGKDVRDAIRNLVRTLFLPIGGGFDLKRRITDAQFEVNNTTMEGDPFYFVVKGIWIQYRVEKILCGVVMESRDRTIEKVEWNHVTAESFENPFLIQSSLTQLL